MKNLTTFLSLFTSVGTLLYCALPALFVTLGFGAALAGLVGTIPQLVWISENKIGLFSAGGIFLSVGGFLQWRARLESCPIDPISGEVCAATRDWSKITYLASIGIYGVGFFFAFIAPRIFSS